MISLLENTGFNAEYEWTQLSAVERIKLEDDTIGFRATFDVRTVETYDSEGYGYDQGMEGYVDVAMDNDGNILDTQSDIRPGDYEV